jgi:hypothetical protein
MSAPYVATGSAAMHHYYSWTFPIQLTTVWKAVIH